MDFETVMQELAEQLYDTGNYDAMYFAGVIADPKSMTEADFDRWMDAAYFTCSPTSSLP